MTEVKRAFDADVIRIHYCPDNKSIIHADLKIGDSILMLLDEFPDMKTLWINSGTTFTAS